MVYPLKGFTERIAHKTLCKNAKKMILVGLLEETRHININFLLWLTSRWPWDKRLVVPGLTGPKSLCVRLKKKEI